MHAFLSKVFGRKKDDKEPSPTGLLPGELLDGKFEAVSPNVSPAANNFLELDPKANEQDAQDKDKDGVFSLFRAKSRPSSPEIKPKKLTDTLPQLSLNFPGLGEGSNANTIDSLLELDVDSQILLSDTVIGERRLNPLEALVLIRACSQAIISTGLETLGVMHPHWYSSSPEVQRRLISQFIHSLKPAPQALMTPLSLNTTLITPFEAEVNSRSPYDVAAVLRWGLRHLQLDGDHFGTDDEWYKAFLDAEAAASYPPKAFSEKLAPKLPSAHLDLLIATLEIISSLAAHSEANGTSGNKLSKIFGLWLLTARRVEEKDDWHSFYQRWERTGRMLEHLFLARIRDESSDQRMPVRLLELVRKYPYTQGLSSPTADLQLLPPSRFSMQPRDALFVRIEVELPSGKRKPKSKIHPLNLLADAFSTKVEEGDHVEIWAKITAASKNGTSPSPLSNIFADETIRFLSIIPEASRDKSQEAKSPAFSIVSPSSPRRQSFTVAENGKNESQTRHTKVVTDPFPITPVSATEIGSDWAQFSSSGFLDNAPAMPPLVSTLFDTDVEKTVPPDPTLSRKSSKRTRPPAASRKSVDFAVESLTPPLPKEKVASVEEVKTVVKASKIDIIQVDEAFIDFWSDSLLDPITLSWPTFIICKFKSTLVPQLTYGPVVEGQNQKTLKWLVLEQVFTTRSPTPPPPIETVELVSPSSPTPSTSSRKIFSFFSRSTSGSSIGSQKGKKKEKGPKIGEMGELLEEDVEVAQPRISFSRSKKSMDRKTTNDSIPKVEEAHKTAEKSVNDNNTAEYVGASVAETQQPAPSVKAVEEVAMQSLSPILAEISLNQSEPRVAEAETQSTRAGIPLETMDQIEDSAIQAPVPEVVAEDNKPEPIDIVNHEVAPVQVEPLSDDAENADVPRAPSYEIAAGPVVETEDEAHHSPIINAIIDEPASQAPCSFDSGDVESTQLSGPEIHTSAESIENVIEYLPEEENSGSQRDEDEDEKNIPVQSMKLFASTSHRHEVEIQPGISESESQPEVDEENHDQAIHSIAEDPSLVTEDLSSGQVENFGTIDDAEFQQQEELTQDDSPVVTPTLPSLELVSTEGNPSVVEAHLLVEDGEMHAALPLEEVAVDEGHLPAIAAVSELDSNSLDLISVPNSESLSLETRNVNEETSNESVEELATTSSITEVQDSLNTSTELRAEQPASLESQEDADVTSEKETTTKDIPIEPLGSLAPVPDESLLSASVISENDTQGSMTVEGHEQGAVLRADPVSEDRVSVEEQIIVEEITVNVRESSPDKDDIALGEDRSELDLSQSPVADTHEASDAAQSHGGQNSEKVVEREAEDADIGTASSQLTAPQEETPSASNDQVEGAETREITATDVIEALPPQVTMAEPQSGNELPGDRDQNEDISHLTSTEKTYVGLPPVEGSSEDAFASEGQEEVAPQIVLQEEPTSDVQQDSVQEKSDINVVDPADQARDDLSGNEDVLISEVSAQDELPPTSAIYPDDVLVTDAPDGSEEVSATGDSGVETITFPQEVELTMAGNDANADGAEGVENLVDRHILPDPVPSVEEEGLTETERSEPAHLLDSSAETELALASSTEQSQLDNAVAASSDDVAVSLLQEAATTRENVEDVEHTSAEVEATALETPETGGSSLTEHVTPNDTVTSSFELAASDSPSQFALAEDENASTENASIPVIQDEVVADSDDAKIVEHTGIDGHYETGENIPVLEETSIVEEHPAKGQEEAAGLAQQEEILASESDIVQVEREHEPVGIAENETQQAESTEIGVENTEGDIIESQPAEVDAEARSYEANSTIEVAPPPVEALEHVEESSNDKPAESEPSDTGKVEPASEIVVAAEQAEVEPEVQAQAEVESKAEEVKAEEPVAEEPVAEEAQVEDVKTEEVKIEEPVAEEVKAEEAGAEEIKAEEIGTEAVGAQVVEAEAVLSEASQPEAQSFEADSEGQLGEEVDIQDVLAQPEPQPAVEGASAEIADTQHTKTEEVEPQHEGQTLDVEPGATVEVQHLDNLQEPAVSAEPEKEDNDTTTEESQAPESSAETTTIVPKAVESIEDVQGQPEAQEDDVVPDATYDPAASTPPAEDPAVPTEPTSNDDENDPSALPDAKFSEEDTIPAIPVTAGEGADNLIAEEGSPAVVEEISSAPSESQALPITEALKETPSSAPDAPPANELATVPVSAEAISPNEEAVHDADDLPAQTTEHPSTEQDVAVLPDTSEILGDGQSQSDIKDDTGLDLQIVSDPPSVNGSIEPVNQSTIETSSISEPISSEQVAALNADDEVADATAEDQLPSAVEETLGAPEPSEEAVLSLLAESDDVVHTAGPEALATEEQAPIETFNEDIISEEKMAVQEIENPRQDEIEPASSEQDSAVLPELADNLGDYQGQTDGREGGIALETKDEFLLGSTDITEPLSLSAANLNEGQGQGQIETNLPEPISAAQDAEASMNPADAVLEEESSTIAEEASVIPEPSELPAAMTEAPEAVISHAAGPDDVADEGLESVVTPTNEDVDLSETSKSNIVEEGPPAQVAQELPKPSESGFIAEVKIDHETVVLSSEDEAIPAEQVAEEAEANLDGNVDDNVQVVAEEESAENVANSLPTEQLGPAVPETNSEVADVVSSLVSGETLAPKTSEPSIPAAVEDSDAVLSSVDGTDIPAAEESEAITTLADEEILAKAAAGNLLVDEPAPEPNFVEETSSASDRAQEYPQSSEMDSVAEVKIHHHEALPIENESSSAGQIAEEPETDVKVQVEVDEEAATEAVHPLVAADPELANIPPASAEELITEPITEPESTPLAKEDALTNGSEEALDVPESEVTLTGHADMAAAPDALIDDALAVDQDVAIAAEESAFLDEEVITNEADPVDVTESINGIQEPIHVPEAVSQLEQVADPDASVPVSGQPAETKLEIVGDPVLGIDSNVEHAEAESLNGNGLHIVEPTVEKGETEQENPEADVSGNGVVVEKAINNFEQEPLASGNDVLPNDDAEVTDPTEPLEAKVITAVLNPESNADDKQHDPLNESVVKDEATAV